ncbi:MAG: phosphotransferase [Acidimicrobiia bacterium]
MSITKETKAALGQKVIEATDEGFLDARIRPLLNGDAPPDGGGTWATRVIQLDSTGAATVELRLGDGRAVFAKFFPHGEGQAVYDKLNMLRHEGGFGSGSDNQVVEPLGYLGEFDLLIAREALGPSVADVLAGDDPAARLDAVAKAGTWIGRLHSTPLRIGRPHSLIVSTEILSVTRRLAKVAAEDPGTVKRAVGMVEQLERLAEDTVDGLNVQSHGQYRPIHVFLGGGATTVIDLDRSRPADPARDTAEFIHRLRRQATGARRSDAEVAALTDGFLDAYGAAVPDRGAWMANLRFHWARFVFHSMNRKLKKGSDDEDARTVANYDADFAALVEGRLLGS